MSTCNTAFSVPTRAGIFAAKIFDPRKLRLRFVDRPQGAWVFRLDRAPQDIRID